MGQIVSNIGQMDRRIVIQSRSTAKDAFNQDLKSWEALDTVWASIKPTAKPESVESDQKVGYTMMVFQIRHRTDLDQTMQVVFGGQTYEIKSIVEVIRNKRQDLYCTARDNE